MKNKNIKITSTIVLALLFAGIITQTIGFWGMGSTRQQSQPRTTTQATPTPLNLAVQLNADGASFPAPFIFNITAEYHLSHPNVTITYQSVGSGKGQRDFINKTMDFAASDAPLNAAQRILAPNALHIPETIGSVTAAYNLPGIVSGLDLNGSTLANIYLGNIGNWNDPAIQQQNPSVILPNQPIKVAHRSDSSGTTFVWTSFLCLDSALWCSTVGAGTAVNWPVGVGANGNAGVATYVNSTTYALGYVELNYALQNHMTFAAVKNPVGNYILPSLTTTAYAVANSTQTLPPGAGDWSSVSLLNAAGASTYPIASFTYFLVYKELNVIPSMDLVDKIQAKALIDFLNWEITTGQSFAPALSYVPLPSAVVSLDQATINSITFTEISTPASKSINLKADATLGWGLTNPGPFISAASGDTITLNLISNDGLQHQWYIDFNNNGVLDSNENWTTVSPVFSSTTIITVFTFKPIIWFQEGIPSAGDFIYRDSFHPTITGTIRGLPQQTAAVLTPGSTLSSSLAPSLDSSRVSTIGSAIIDLRTQSLSGNLTAVAVDKTSGSTTFIKSYVIPSVTMKTVQGGTSPTFSLSFCLNVAVLPYSLSTDITVTISIPTASTITSSTSTQLNRELDIGGVGVVNIIALATVAIFFGGTVGTSGYNGPSDVNADGTINIVDLVTIAIHFGQLAFR